MSKLNAWQLKFSNKITWAFEAHFLSFVTLLSFHWNPGRILCHVVGFLPR